MREIAPRLWHWTARREHIGGDVNSYYLERERVLIDAMVPAEGLEWLERHGPPQHVLMSNRHHDRHAWQLQERFGCSVHCVRNTKRGLRDAYRVLLELDFDRLLLAHGEPLASGARAALREFVAVQA